MSRLSLTAQNNLLGWYSEVRRDLPWRKNVTPYGTWVSEIMLQQTQVATVIDYWLRWMDRFPSVEALAGAKEDEVLAMWQGLGYYRRAKLLQRGAQAVVERGSFPKTAAEWQEIPGVGRYTAGAIASIAFGEPAALVDGNVERVYARLAADPAVGAELNRQAWRWAEESLATQDPGSWNQALMELGATVCRPVTPQCLLCPLQDACRALATGEVANFPRPKPKVETVELEHLIWVPYSQGKWGIRRIPEGRWWSGMWEFPREASAEAFEALDREGNRQPVGHFRHAVTHHRIHVEVSLVLLNQPLANLTWVSADELEHYALPAPQKRAFRMAQALLSGSVK